MVDSRKDYPKSTADLKQDYKQLLKQSGSLEGAYRQVLTGIAPLEREVVKAFVGMKDAIIGHLKAEKKERMRQPDSYLEEAVNILDGLKLGVPIAVIGNIPEKNKYLVIVYVNEALERDLGWNIDDVRERDYTTLIHVDKNRGESERAYQERVVRYREEIKAALKGEQPEIKLKIRSKRGKPATRIIRKVDIPYKTITGETGAITVVAIRHPAVFGNKYAKTIDVLRREYEDAEAELERKKEMEELDKKVQQTLQQARQNQDEAPISA